MSRRDLIQEIAVRRSRNPQTSRIQAFSSRVDAISSAFQRLVRVAEPDSLIPEEELGRYFPVALVAAVEGYFRQCVADLVNRGGPFLERAAKLKDVSLTLHAASAIKQERISLGDYVAHFISISSLDDINRALSTLLGMDFLDRLLSSHFNVFEGEEALVLDKEREAVVNAARDLFQLRHILCHEFAADVRPTNGDIVRLMTIADVLVSLSEVIVMCEEQDHAG